MLPSRLDSEIHGSDGYTTIPRVVAIVALVGFIAIGLNLALQSQFAGKILPGVVVSGQPVGGLTLSQARSTLQQQAVNYELKLKIEGKDFVIKPDDIGVSYDSEQTLKSAYMAGRNVWMIPWHIAPINYSYALDRQKAIAMADSIAAQIGVAPVDASLVVKDGKVTTIPDKTGMSVDRLGLLKIIERDVAAPTKAIIPVSPRVVVADIRTTNLEPVIKQANQLMSTPITLNYKDKAYSPTARDIGQWLSFEKINQDSTPTMTAKIDTSKVKGYLQELANKLNVAPVPKKVTVENGVSKVTQEGVDGTSIDQDALVSQITDAVNSRKPLVAAVTDRPVAFKTVSTSIISLDYGQYIEINLSRQHLWVWQDHNVIYETPITSGATGAGFPTVQGLFSIFYKTTNTRLVGYQYGPRYQYDVAVKYWMPFHDGYGLHDASWRNGNFGGQDYYYGGSHGCVNLPDAAAAFIYKWSSIGTPVWVHS